jgi:hypothetical protein
MMEVQGEPKERAHRNDAEKVEPKGGEPLRCHGRPYTLMTPLAIVGVPEQAPADVARQTRKPSTTPFVFQYPDIPSHIAVCPVLPDVPPNAPTHCAFADTEGL